jgi:FAD-linked sulfhydryl oxidase
MRRLVNIIMAHSASARHFQGLLKENPPIVDNREALTQWMCTIHNKVNDRLGKPIFDCSKVGEMWKCGCAEEEKK